MADLPDTNLLNTPVFTDIPEVTVKDLCARGRVVRFGAGHVLFERGGSAEELMILQEGIVELIIPIQILGVAREVTMESKRAGDVVAWSALVSPYSFTLSARCAGDCTLTAFGRGVLQAFFEADPTAGYLFMRNLAGVIGRRLQMMQTMWLHNLQATAAEPLE